MHIGEPRIIMGMPITVEVVDESVMAAVFEEFFSYFEVIDTQFSLYIDYFPGFAQYITLSSFFRILPSFLSL